MICLSLYRTGNKLKLDENMHTNHNYCNVKIPEENKNILKFNQEQKSVRILFTIYVESEYLLNKILLCHNNPKES